MEVRKDDQIEEISIYNLEDFSIGHSQNYDAITGCTVIICNNRQHAATGVDVRGGDPGVRNIEGIRPENGMKYCDAIVLSGGSSFGLNAAGGAERYLEEQGIGDRIGDIVIPTVSQAILFDLRIGSHKIRPDVEMAYEACLNSCKKIQYEDGNIGAGTGATVGKIRGRENTMKGGLGTYCIKKGDLYVGVIIAVNAIGDVVDPKTSEILAGALKDGEFVNAEEYVLNNFALEEFESGNTTIGCVITNAKIDKAKSSKLAMMSHDGMARAIRPIHTMGDGDTMFAMTTGEVEVSMNLLEIMTVTATERAIVSAIKNADSMGGRISYREKKVKEHSK